MATLLITTSPDDDDVMNLTVSEEEASEFSLDVPSTVVVPNRITAPSSTVNVVDNKTQRENVPSGTIVDNADVEMDNGNEKLVVETFPNKAIPMVDVSDLPALYSSLVMDLEASPGEYLNFYVL